MSTAVIAASVAVNASVAATNEQREERECRELMQGYNHELATFEEVQAYGHCVNTLYQKGDQVMPEGLAWAFLISLVVAVVCGIIQGYREHWNPMEIVWGFFLGIVGAWLVLGFIALTIAAIQTLN